MSKLFALAVPILPGKTEECDKFLEDLNGARHKDFCESRKRLNVRERTFLQKTQHGDMVIVTLEGEDPAAAFAGFAAGNDEFTKWFVGKVKEIHGFDLTAPPPGPLPELVVDSLN